METTVSRGARISLLFFGSFLLAVCFGCASRISVVEVRENYHDVKSLPPSSPGFESIPDALGKGLLGGLTPEGIMLGGPLVTGLLAAVSMTGPCIDVLRELDAAGPRLESIVAALDMSRFSEQLQVKLQYFQELERSKKFDLGGVRYGETSKDFILDVDRIHVVLQDEHLDFACYPLVAVSARWRLTKVSDGGSSQGYTSCSGSPHQESFLDWYGQPLEATQEISLLLDQLAQAIAAEVATGYDVDRCK